MTTNHQTTRPPIAVVGVSALFPGSVDSTGFWNDILSGADRMTDVPSTHWLIDDHYDADPSAPDKTYGRRGGFLEPIDFDAMGFGVPPSVDAVDRHRATPGADRGAAGARRRAARPVQRTRSQPGVGDPRGDVGAGAVRRDGQPHESADVAAGHASRRRGRRRRSGGVRPDPRPASGVDREHVPGTARQRRRRTDRQPPRPRRHQLRHRRGVCIVVLGDLDGDQRVVPRRQRPGDRRRRRHHERHLHVHVLLEDAGAVQVRGHPAVLRPGRRHDARRGHRDGGAEAPRRRRTRRQRHLLRRQRGRRQLRRAIEERLRPGLVGPGAGRSRTRTRRPATVPTPSSWSRPTAPAPSRATPPNSADSNSPSTPRTAPTGSGARSDRSRARSATPRPPPAPPVSSRS